ncbi:MAG: hypothetical protein JNL74_19515 [Fibrobacteres bacterium]|nr:hypothetical protein [Fibrobacterota bacterium]
MNITLELSLGKYSTLSLRCNILDDELSDEPTEGLLYCNCVEPEKFLLCAKDPQLVMPNGNRKPIKMIKCVKSKGQTIITYKSGVDK